MLALLLCLTPYDAPQETRCDVIEVQDFYDDCGEHVFRQIIGWERVNGVERVVGWRLWKDRIVERDSRGWRAWWVDDDGAHCVRARSYRRTWRQVDSELLDRERFCKEKRRGIR